MTLGGGRLRAVVDGGTGDGRAGAVESAQPYKRVNERVNERGRR